MSKFTPGPWDWDDSYKNSQGNKTWSLIGQGGYGILSCDGEENSPQCVNPLDARLIAAAPDLYDAVVGLLSKVDRDDCPVQWDRAEAAMGKAVDEL